MRRWGIVISAFYAAIVAVLLMPFAVRLLGASWAEAFDPAGYLELQWWWLWPGMLIGGEALLLFLSVDTSFRRRRPRQHIALSAVICGMFAALLALGMLVSILDAAKVTTETWLSPLNDRIASLLGWLFGLWLLWGIVFYWYYRASPGRFSRGVSWLLGASVLELLVAIPAHVIIRRRDECTALPATAFGIPTGLAVMLACFGPGVLALYKKRLDRYRRQPVEMEVQR